ncbi:hypothetical protein [Streptomyces tibetensis]|uniref:Integral membrane protein n=1 Tax=Streptomyces tibetensis TaxID=2382123 RepID=A0ABW6MWC6_9ACTN
MDRHHQVSDGEGRGETSGGRGAPDSVPPLLLPLEIAVFVAVTVAVTALALAGIQLVKSPVVIGTTYTALLLAGAGAVGVAAATYTRGRLLRRRRRS